MPRVALVTGGMGGLGEAVCIKLAGLGYKVVTTYSPGNAKVKDWLQSMHNLGYGFKAYECDVTDFESCRQCIATITEAVGPISVLVNNAGITRDMTFKKMTKADWDAVTARSSAMFMAGKGPERRQPGWQLDAGAYDIVVGRSAADIVATCHINVVA